MFANSFLNSAARGTTTVSQCTLTSDVVNLKNNCGVSRHVVRSNERMNDYFNKDPVHWAGAVDGSGPMHGLYTAPSTAPG